MEFASFPDTEDLWVDILMVLSQFAVNRFSITLGSTGFSLLESWIRNRGRRGLGGFPSSPAPRRPWFRPQLSESEKPVEFRVSISTWLENIGRTSLMHVNNLVLFIGGSLCEKFIYHPDKQSPTSNARPCAPRSSAPVSPRHHRTNKVRPRMLGAARLARTRVPNISRL